MTTDLVQIAERALADAEAALRVDPSEANRRKVMEAWAFVQRAREQARAASADRRGNLERDNR
jgi:hypothetical protein